MTTKPHGAAARPAVDPDALPSYAQLMRRTDAPPGSSWGLFGPGDQLGTLNLLRARPLTEAAREIRSGTAFSLDLPSDAISPPLAPTRRPLEHHLSYLPAARRSSEFSSPLTRLLRAASSA